jgi:hypothetical protein
VVAIASQWKHVCAAQNDYVTMESNCFRQFNLSILSQRECSSIASHRSAFDHCDLLSSKESCSVRKTCSVPAVVTGRAGFNGEVAPKL